MELQLFTVGHSTHPLPELLALLNQHHIGAIADIRRFPASRKFPQFNQGALASALEGAGVEYHWLESLGGRRGKTRERSSVENLGLENAGFRNYADYMATGDFERGVDTLLDIARRKRTAMLCAEAVYWRCHRRLVSDYLTANGIAVQHIMPNGDLRPHELTRGAAIQNGHVTYPGEKSVST
jgi:uncharacterized protein (DUF488 family)